MALYTLYQTKIQSFNGRLQALLKTTEKNVMQITAGSKEIICSCEFFGADKY